MIAFPWGDRYPEDCTLANYKYCLGDTSMVGNYPLGASPYGVMDMAGNVWEWVNDWYSDSYYSGSPGSNPPGPDTGSYRVLRGGAWDAYDYALSVANRDSINPALQGQNIGFRCVAAVP